MHITLHVPSTVGNRKLCAGNNTFTEYQILYPFKMQDITIIILLKCLCVNKSALNKLQLTFKAPSLISP